VYAVVAACEGDQQIWQDIHSQLHSLLDGFSDVEIEEGIRPGDDAVGSRIRAVDAAQLILLLLSEDFLASPDCMAAANRALERADAHDASVLAMMLRPCDVEGSRLARVRMVSEHAIVHVSRYAQEQRVVEAAKAIRRLLVTLMMRGRTTGPMNLLHWLLWQLYGNGHASCPYWQIGHYAVKHVRPSALAGILIHLLDLQRERMVGEYLIGPLRCPDLAHLLQVIAPTVSNPEYVQGIAQRDHPLKHGTIR